MDKGAWWAPVHQGHKELDTTEQLTHTHTHTHIQIGQNNHSSSIKQSQGALVPPQGLSVKHRI